MQNLSVSIPFFAPLLAFYVLTVWYPTVNRNRTKTEGVAGDWVSRLTSVHVDRIYPSANAMSFSPALYRWLVVLMSALLILASGRLKAELQTPQFAANQCLEFLL